MIKGRNPCDVCERKNYASGCSRCVLDTNDIKCNNYKCFLQYEDSCMLGIGKVCKSSTEYEDDVYDHDCDDCEKFTVKYDEDGCEYYTCGKNGAQVGLYDTACFNFKERKEEE